MSESWHTGTPKIQGLTRVSVMRQNNTTNSTNTNSVILTGWGIYAQAAVSFKSETVTFGVTFAAAPITLISYSGDNANVSTAYGSGGNNIKGPVSQKTITQTTTDFVAGTQPSDATTWGATDNVFYTWMAIGEVA